MDLTQKNWSKIVQEMNDVIDEIYGKGNKEYYLQRVDNSEFPLPQKVVDFCRANRILYTFHRLPKLMKSITWDWRFDFPSRKSGDFKWKYTTTLSVAKLCGAFCLFNSFEIYDLDPCAFDPRIDAEAHGGGPVTQLQDELCQLVMEWLEGEGRTLLRNWVYEQCVVGLENLEKKEMFEDHAEDVPPEAFYCSYYDVFFGCCEFESIRAAESYYAKREYDRKGKEARDGAL